MVGSGSSETSEHNDRLMIYDSVYIFSMEASQFYQKFSCSFPNSLHSKSRIFLCN